MKSEIITIGDELLLGQIPNSNAVFISKKLTEIGIEVCRHTTIGDKKEWILEALDRALSEFDVVITTGGLGPTNDDITKNVVAEFFNSKLILKNDLLEEISARFARRGIKMAEINKEQALFPEKATMIPNPIGTAPGMQFEKNGHFCFVIPGVPGEMKTMVTETILPFLNRISGNQIINYRMLHTTGIPESSLFEKLGDIAEIEKFTSISFLPEFTGVSIRLTAKGSNEGDIRQRIKQAEVLVRNKIEKWIFGSDDESLEQIVGRMLVENNLTVAIAESCSGGLLSNRLTNIPGCSSYFERGVVTYSNRAKKELLNIDDKTIEEFGAVSEPVAIQMAKNIRELAKTDIGVSITGIAGPTGGTPDKPVGLVYIGYADAKKAIAKKYRFLKDRDMNKKLSTQSALNLIRVELINLN